MKLENLFPGASPSDYKLYLEDTLVLTKFVNGVTERDYSLCHVVKVQERAPYEIKINDLATKNMVLLTPDLWNLRLPQVSLGFYSVRRTAVFLTRTGFRQNKKGICKHTFQSFNVFELINQTLPAVYGGEISFRLLQSFMVFDTPAGFFEILTTPQRFFSLPAACQRIAQNKVFARALSPHFAVSAGIRTNTMFTIWYDELPIGDINQDLVIRVTEPLFFQETIDMFGQNYEVSAV